MAEKTSITRELARAEEELSQLRDKITELRKQIPPEKIGEYEFKTGSDETITLAELFGDKNDLIVIHNMGKNCPYCTLWADGFNGVYQHLEDRAGFVVVSPDSPATMKKFAEGRDWKFIIVSNDGGPFTGDMGYEDENGHPDPGISTFHREPDGTIYRIAHTGFGPGDDYCAIWHMFDMLKDGPDGWQPKFGY